MSEENTTPTEPNAGQREGSGVVMSLINRVVQLLHAVREVQHRHRKHPQEFTRIYLDRDSILKPICGRGLSCDQKVEPHGLDGAGKVCEGLGVHEDSSRSSVALASVDGAPVTSFAVGAASAPEGTAGHRQAAGSSRALPYSPGSLGAIS